MGEINVIILYQVAIFAIIILSSFAGFKGLFTREWLRPSQVPPGVLKFSSGKLM